MTTGAARLLSGLALVLVAWPRFVAAESDVWHLYFLGGQSNMEGFGYASELTAEQSEVVDRVWIFAGNTRVDGEAADGLGVWAPLQPGFGRGFSSDGQQNVLTDRFGPELGFGRRMSELYPDRKIAIIKYSRGGSSLQEGASGYGDWEPDAVTEGGVNQYDHALATLRNALSQAELDGDGAVNQVLPAGIAWMQGEGDAQDPVAARAYRNNLKRLMDLLRAALRTDDLPVVIGRITDSHRDEDGLLMDYSPQVQQAQADYTANDACAALVAPDWEMNWSDNWHYGTQDYLRLGAEFADALSRLEADCP